MGKVQQRKDITNVEDPSDQGYRIVVYMFPVLSDEHHEARPDVSIEKDV